MQGGKHWTLERAQSRLLFLSAIEVHLLFATSVQNTFLQTMIVHEPLTKVFLWLNRSRL